MNNKGTDQTAGIRRLGCVFVVCKPPKTGFLASRPILCNTIPFLTLKPHNLYVKRKYVKYKKHNKLNKCTPYCYVIQESHIRLKENPLPQPIHGIDDHGMCMTNLPVHLI